MLGKSHVPFFLDRVLIFSTCVLNALAQTHARKREHIHKRGIYFLFPK